MTDTLDTPRWLAVGTGVTERPARVLVVDDDDDARRFATEELTRAGFMVDQATDGAEALMAIDSSPPDLVIADLQMPQLDGRQLLDALRRRHETASLPFVVLSGSAGVDQRVACLDAGANDVLSKPIDGTELVARARLQLRTISSLQRLRTASEVDELSEVLNRRGVMRALDRELAHSRRAEQPLALLLVDADHFKRINDEHGHLVGDRAIRAIADCLAAAVRSNDTVGRLGGDEFIVILPETDGDAASEVAERIRRRAADSLRVPGTREPIGLSIGIVAGPAGGGDIEYLIDAADRAMYRDKAARR